MLDPRTFASAITFALALRLTSAAHEAAHALAALAVGARPAISNFSVHARTSAGGAIAIALAGPLFSLLQGGTLLLLPLAGFGGGPLQLLLVWLALHGLSNFFGYLVSAGFARSGDIAFVLRRWEASTLLRVFVTIVGFAGIIFVGRICCNRLLPFVEDPASLSTAQGRRHTILWLGVVPWLLGAATVAASGFPFRNRFGTLYELVSGAFTIAALRMAARLDPSEVTPQSLTPRALWAWSLALALVLATTRLVLGRPTSGTG